MSNLVALVIGVSFAAGLNVYATVFVLGLLSRLHWVALPGGLSALDHIWVLAASALLFAVEFFADKIPGFDLLWNALHTFVRITVAALLAYQATEHLSPAQRLLVTALGGAVALVAHGSKTAARAVVTPSPEPVSNIALSSAEDAAAIGMTWAATHHPYATGLLATGLCAAGIALMMWGWRAVKRRVRGWKERRQDPAFPAVSPLQRLLSPGRSK